MVRALSLSLVLALVLLLSSTPALAETPTFKVGVSIWTGWMPFYLMDAKGILAKRAGEQGVAIKVEKFKDYMASVQAFAAGNLDACAMTIMESYQPAASGIDVRALIVNDFSAGGDGVLAKKGLTLKDMKGKQVLLEEGSVSHYLLIRALESGGLTEGQVMVKNIGGDDAGKAFLAGQCDFAVTWNPHLSLAKEDGKGEILYDSRQIPGEIIDLLIWNGKKLDRDPRPARALVAAWYDAMEMITSPKTREEAIACMAKEAGATPDEFKKMLTGTDLFTDAKRTKEFMDGDQIKKTAESVKKFLLKHGKLEDDAAKVTFDSKFITVK
ncbi:MAG: ABC transporter substrate-binding protein [Candidatus Riflebacteria bacterium]|nr:ABC transporter substrate-binding protein [Candidatus Riflebacteria bacterium]